MSIEEIVIESAKSGDGKALSSIYNTIKPFVKLTIMRKFANQIKYDEIDYHVHCIVSKVLLKISYYSVDKGAFTTWVSKLTNNYVYDLFRNKQYKNNQSNISIDMNQTEEGDNTLANILYSGDDIEKTLKQVASIYFVDRLIDKYSKNDEHKRIIRLRYKDDLAYDEIEKKTGKPVGSIKSILFRFRNKCLEVNNNILKEYD